MLKFADFSMSALPVFVFVAVLFSAPTGAATVHLPGYTIQRARVLSLVPRAADGGVEPVAR